MHTFVLFCTESRTREIVRRLQDNGFLVDVEKGTTGSTTFHVEAAPAESEELTDIRVLRGIIAVLTDYASDDPGVVILPAGKAAQNQLNPDSQLRKVRTKIR